MAHPSVARRAMPVKPRNPRVLDYPAKLFDHASLVLCRVVRASPFPADVTRRCSDIALGMKPIDHGRVLPPCPAGRSRDDEEIEGAELGVLDSVGALPQRQIARTAERE